MVHLQERASLFVRDDSGSAEELLRDGDSLWLRSARPDDARRLDEHFRTLSSRSLYLRFCSPRQGLKPYELERLTNVDSRRHLTLVATLDNHGEAPIVGVGEYIVADPEHHPDRADFSSSVTDAHQGRGIGTLLLEHLARIARENGITEFEADALGDNRKMIGVFVHSGFTLKSRVECGLLHVTFPIAETERFRRARDARRCTAEAAHRRPEYPATSREGEALSPVARAGVHRDRAIT